MMDKQYWRKTTRGRIEARIQNDGWKSAQVAIESIPLERNAIRANALVERI